MISDVRASMVFLLLQQQIPVSKIAEKLNMSEKTVRKYRDEDQLPSQIPRPERTYRTRQDPLDEFWPEIEDLLEQDSRLKPYALLDWLKQQHNPPGQEPRVTDSIRRTLERRVQRWKLEHGVEKEVKFPQTHHAGDVIAFDFVRMDSLKITLDGKPFEHMLFHSIFTYSNWEYVHVCHSESFEALATGLQDALHRAGGVPRRVRSDSLSAAVNNLSNDKEFTAAYRELLQHYGLQGHRINVRKPHENGDVESSHGHFKDALDQALRLRGSRDFAHLDDYLTFVRELLKRKNDGREKRFLEEAAALEPLPPQRRCAWTSLFVNVKSDSVIRVKRNAYSVSSKYLGFKLEVRIYQDHLELWHQNASVERMPRQFGCGNEAIDFRHVIDSLIRKPGAFVNYKYVHHMYPTTRFRMAYDQLQKQTTEASAVKQYLKLLHAAKHEGLDLVDDALRWFLKNGKPICAADVLALLSARQAIPAPTEVRVEAPDLSQFDFLLQHPEIYDEQEACQFPAPLANGQDGEDDEKPGGLAAYDRHVATAGSTEGVASADVPREPCLDGGASGAGVLDAHPIPGGPGGAGMPGADAGADCAFDARRPSVVGQNVGSVRLDPVAASREATIRDASSGRLFESSGQRVAVRKTGHGENDVVIGVGRSTGHARPLGVVLDVPDAGSGVASRQARSSSGASDQEASEVRGVDHRRPGLCAAKPGRDGGAVHVIVGALRAGERAFEFEPSVFEMGANLQGPDDDRGGDRPSDPSLGHRGAEHRQLSPGRGQEETSRQKFQAWSYDVARPQF
jgi:transposase InsO family protein